MSKREDIIDGTRIDINTKKYGLIYTCVLGWLDLGHANPDGASKLWSDICNQAGTKSKDGKGYKISYRQEMRTRILKWTRSVGYTGEYYVSTGLSNAQKESVALSIFAEVSYNFEKLQGSFPYSLKTADSSFSAEDLISDLLGFYRTVRPKLDYLYMAQPVSKETAQKVWDDYGAVGKNKNSSFGVYLYKCKDCKNKLGGPACAPLPSWLNVIRPAKRGDLYHDWSKSD